MKYHVVLGIPEMSLCRSSCLTSELRTTTQKHNFSTTNRHINYLLVYITDYLVGIHGPPPQTTDYPVPKRRPLHE
jgi:hypothetical protein